MRSMDQWFPLVTMMDLIAGIDTGFPIFQEYGFPGVVWINAENWWVGLGNNGYHAVDTLLEMQTAGWEISSHTYDHDGPLTNGKSAQ